MTLNHSTLAAITLSLFAAACSTTPTTSASMDSADPEMSVEQPIVIAAPMVRATYQPEGDAVTLVLMRANTDMHAPSHDELAELTTGHGEFMQSMTSEGYVLAQGPIIPPRSSGELRSMYFVDSEDPISVYDRVCNDPAAESGLYEMEAMTFITESNIRAFVPMNAADAPQMRVYAAVIAPSSAAMTAMLQQMEDVVVFYGHCTSGSLEDSTLCIIDANTIDEARRIMAVVGTEAEDFQYHAWVSPVMADRMN